MIIKSTKMVFTVLLVVLVKKILRFYFVWRDKNKEKHLLHRRGISGISGDKIFKR